ncbi:hypothetical protein Ciccas_001486 [Cichlidogyrus casuarinus]|uniref:Band 7 domain-containing protein n=1 Tax=Cichlidogyrus casuarinus TaxID=1844966 RepID=A0ABD2QJV3_9PLAT
MEEATNRGFENETIKRNSVSQVEMPSNRIVPVTKANTNKKNDRIIDDEPPSFSCCGLILVVFSVLLFILTFPVSIFLSVRTINEFERGVILRLGKCVRENGKSTILKPGVRLILPCTDTLLKIDLRTKSFNIPPQDVLTKDAVSCNVDAIVYMRVVDPASALLKVDDAIQSAKFVAISSLRTVIGNYTLTMLLQDRNKIDEALRVIIDEATDRWGILVERVDIKDVSLPDNMQRAMAAEAQASRQSKARVIAAQGELEASTALTEASKKFDTSPAALHLRYLETLTTISAEKNSTILFPLPMEFFKTFMGKKD